MKTVLVTGSSSGFGRDVVKRFAAEGWNVVATMRLPEREKELASSERMLVTRLDVEDRESIASAVAEAERRFGGIDVLVNNAGFGIFGVFEETPRARVMEQFAVNVFGAMDVTRAVLPGMRARRSGVVVNVTSGAGVFTAPLASMYCASKFALEGFSEGLSWELAAVGVKVKLVEPGGVLETKFGERTAAETAHRQPVADYEKFLVHSAGVYEELRNARGLGTSAGVAGVIYEAATDGTDRLRYVATEDIAPLVAMRRETSEEKYMGFLRERFAMRG